ncbi:hypothetical protein STCU_00317 [Strigomonas culicis]|uniref:Uncharacterized protein n=1 Tax=Strigomonas culicis TaxID=28005 RepID=S9UQ04_9TRYP|nr:hypothetical protein STCU_03745 [Strigomonas culicis]EPY36966.1 hypothetical protein STCU_00317 [Strigomonas culicis]|eukprot:EPY30958.1 hypothetical protein STCU_03745 [Strigomonas culicis]
MAQLPWLLVCVCFIPLFMIWTKTKRIDAKEIHTIQMRVKYYAEYWKKGSHFVDAISQKQISFLRATGDPLVGREVGAITEKEWRDSAAAQASLTWTETERQRHARKWWQVIA